jgi:hypothetical protein
MTKVVRLWKSIDGAINCRDSLLCPLPLWERAATLVDAGSFG